MKRMIHNFTKQSLFIVVCILSTTAAEWSWEWVNPSFGLHSFNGMAFNGSQNGIVVGYNGCIAVTHNGGENWKIVKGVTDSTLTKVHFFANKAFVLGNISSLLVSETYGETWKNYPITNGIKLNRIFNFNERLYSLGTKDSAMCVLEYTTQTYCNDRIHVPVLLQSADTGKTWTTVSKFIDSAATDQPPPMPQNYTGLFFHDSNEGFAVGLKGHLQRTTDGGKSWVSIATGQTRDFLDICFVTRDTGFIAGGNGLFLKTTDGGSTWSVIPVVGSFNLLKIQFADKSLGIVTTDNAPYLLTRDGGRTWTKTFPLTSATHLENSYPDVQLCSGDTAYLMARGSEAPIILRSVNKGFNWTATTHTLLYGIDKTVFIDSLHGYGAGCGFDEKGVLYKTDDGGKNWKQCAIPSVGALLDVDFVDSLTGIATGGKNAITTSDGGKTWQTHNLFEYSYGCNAIDNKRFFIGGYNGSISRTINGGTTWDNQNIGKGDVLSFQFVNSRTGYCTGSNGIYITRDSGTTWIQQFPDIHAFRDIHFWNEAKGMAVGFNVYDTLVYFTTENGGNNWKPNASMMLLRGLEYKDVDFLDSLNGVLIGGDIWITEDAGVSWKKQGISTGIMYSVNYLTPEHIIITGSKGKILAGHKIDNRTPSREPSLTVNKPLSPQYLSINGTAILVQTNDERAVDISIYCLNGKAIFNKRLNGTNKKFSFNTSKPGFFSGTCIVIISGQKGILATGMFNKL
jgi:photosystem II stability/assembly factor-like uncharacterized protein